MNNKKNNPPTAKAVMADRGFSLVELIIATTIILVLTGIGVSNFSKLTNSKKMTTTKNEVVTWLNLARNLAITGQLANKELGLKYVKVNFSNGIMDVYGVSGVGETKSFSKVVDSEGKITVTNTAFGFNKGTGRLTDVNGNFIGGPVYVVLNNGSIGESITIDDLGSINEK